MTERRSFPPAPTSAAAVLLTAHPAPDSFNSALAAAWAAGAEGEGVEVEHIDVTTLAFDPCRRGGYQNETALEPDLLRVQAALARAAHVVVAFPLWWGSTPASLKGLFDRAFLPGWAFRFDAGKAFPTPGLNGRSGRLLVTMDAPTWFDALVNRASARKQVAKATLRFCGIKPVRICAYGGVGHSTVEQRQKMLAHAQKAGRKDGARLARRFATDGVAIAA